MSIVGRAHRRDYPAELERLDALSRVRALTDVESMLLQRCLEQAEGRTRVPYGMNKELARAGIKRRWV